MLKFSRILSEMTNVRRTCSSLLLVSFALCIWSSGAAHAQSGRRKPSPSSPTPTPDAATKAGTEGGSESESKPRSASSSKQANATLVDFVVIEDDNMLVDIPYGAKDVVVETFLQRLKQSRAVSVQSASKGNRKGARERAKNEKSAFVVLFQLEEEASDMGRSSIGQADTRALIIKTYIYAPVTGELKFTDRVWQRPYRQTATIGGVRVPVPVSRAERFPSQNQLEQAAREAADRLMSRFNVILPPEN